MVKVTGWLHKKDKHLGSGPPPWSSGTTVVLGPFRPERPVLQSGAMVTTGPKLLLVVMSESMVLMQLGSVLMSITRVTTGVCVNHELNPVLKYECHSELVLTFTGLGRAGPHSRRANPAPVGPIPHRRAVPSHSPNPALENAGPTPHHGRGRAGSAPSPKAGGPSSPD